MRRIYTGLLMAAWLMAPGLAAADTFPTPKGTNQIYHGYIEKGQKFGIRVGDEAAAAQKALTAQGMRDDGLYGCRSYVAEVMPCDSDDVIHLYAVDRLLFTGTVFLFIENGQVSAIGWDTSMVYVDM